MSRFARVSIVAFAVLFATPLAWAGKTRNVILVIADGVRWQEVFTGADPTLLNGDAGGSWTSADELKRKYWNDDPRVKATAAVSIRVGNDGHSRTAVRESAGGKHRERDEHHAVLLPRLQRDGERCADPRIDSNEYGPNPNITVFEWLNTRPGFAGKVEIFAHVGDVRRHFQRQTQWSPDPLRRDSGRRRRHESPRQVAAPSCTERRRGSKARIPSTRSSTWRCASI